MCAHNNLGEIIVVSAGIF